MLPVVCFVSFHELGLKGRNRWTFERRLVENLDAALAVAGVNVRAYRIAGRVIVPVPSAYDAASAEALARRLAAIPGVTSVALAYKIGRDVGEIQSVSLRALREAVVAWTGTGTVGADGAYHAASGADGLSPARETAPTFKVVSRRSNTDFPIPSMELSARIGSYLVEHTGLPVRMKHPDITVSVTVVEGLCYVSTRRVAGIGGLPSGSSGRVVSLLSSGIDSPVATWRLLRRGAIALGLHFSGRPATSGASEQVLADLAQVLARTGGLARVYVVPFGDIQREIASVVAPSLRVIMYRRLMFAVAERLAHAQGAKALATGESLGQVASQTLDNIVATAEITTLPILRPLIGNDKQEIITEARRIDTYDLSIQDADDCCTLFMPRSPETHAKLSVVRRWWDELDTEALIQRACANMTHTVYSDRFGTHK
ncbi:MAG: tRNA 4-thiouridine(8) synthase ThiI [Actinomycetes bacterium]|nr:tRNA 4-thiouridine(8) synthase ThiI [Actinomycetes bacterium]